ncbi:hypothetical protein GCM10028825_08980 [Spirosoma agri]
MIALGIALALLLLATTQSGSGLFAKGQDLSASQIGPVGIDSVKTDPETGLAVDEQLTLVKGQCTACHSSKLILQSHFSRDKWIERIRWMQRTQKLWDLGESEPPILAYLVKHYGPIERPFDGRREPLKNVKWHTVETGH